MNRLGGVQAIARWSCAGTNGGRRVVVEEAGKIGKTMCKILEAKSPILIQPTHVYRGGNEWKTLEPA